MNEASEEMHAFIDELALWVSGHLGGPSVLSLEDADLVRRSVVLMLAWLQEPADRERLNGLLGRAGWQTLDVDPPALDT